MPVLCQEYMLFFCLPLSSQPRLRLLPPPLPCSFCMLRYAEICWVAWAAWALADYSMANRKIAYTLGRGRAFIFDQIPENILRPWKKWRQIPENIFHPWKNGGKFLKIFFTHENSGTEFLKIFFQTYFSQKILTWNGMECLWHGMTRKIPNTYCPTSGG